MNAKVDGARIDVAWAVARTIHSKAQGIATKRPCGLDGRTGGDFQGSIRLKKGNPLSNTNKPSAKKKLSFLKVSRRSGNLPLLDPVVVARNKAKGIETTLLLDTNVLIYMETAVKNGNSW